MDLGKENTAPDLDVPVRATATGAAHTMAVSYRPTNGAPPTPGSSTYAAAEAEQAVQFAQMLARKLSRDMAFKLEGREDEPYLTSDDIVSFVSDVNDDALSIAWLYGVDFEVVPRERDDWQEWD